MTRPRTGARKRWLVLFGAVCVSIAIITNASATFQGTATQTLAITSATMSITVGTNNLGTVPSSNIAPGDTIDREIDLTPSGTSGIFSSWTLTVTSNPGNTNLFTNACTGCAAVHAGLRVTIDKCSVAYSGSVPGNALSCGGTPSSVLAITDANGISGTTLNNMSTSAINYLRVRITFPGGSSNDDTNYQTLSETLTFTFHGVQRAGQQQ